MIIYAAWLEYGKGIRRPIINLAPFIHVSIKARWIDGHKNCFACSKYYSINYFFQPFSHTKKAYFGRRDT